MKQFNPGCLTIKDYLNTDNVKDVLLERLLDMCYTCLEEEDITFDQLMEVVKGVATNLEMTAIRIQMEMEKNEDLEDEDDSIPHYEIFF